MKEKLTNNIGLKLLSLALATLLWLVVINSQDPVETRTFEDIPVTIINEDSLTAKDKIPEVVEGDTVSVVVEARRSVCDKLTKDDIVAVADFEKISVTDAVPIDISVEGYSDHEVEIVRGMNQVMKLRLEDSMTKDFRVKISTTGQTKEGYVIGDMVASPNMITLTGSSTQISKIKEVVLMVDVEGISKDSLAAGVPVIYDMNGDVVSSSKVSMSAGEIQVTIPVLKTKTIRIQVKTTGEPAPGYELGTISYQPDMVTIAGTPSDLVLLGTTLTAYCDITDQSGTVEENIDIASLWNTEYESIRLVDEEKLAVTITMKEFEEKEMEIMEGAVEIRGLDDTLEAQVTELSSHRLAVKGGQESLKGVTLAVLVPYIDLQEYVSPGVYTVPVCLENQGDLLTQDILFAEVVVSTKDTVPVGGGLENNPEEDTTGENVAEPEL
ncbi:MAG: hypothetical protein J6J42_13030 [Lachnospiraceae bacterium]|nr:hypothetical protein [Lachnospiraceae bacterium]MBP3611244.1 hypothetical protein [Lachnospiraceae bacterium]